MIEHGGHDDRTLPHPSAGDIEAACFQFERAWRAGEIGHLEAYLRGIPFDARGQLLQDLVAREMDLRREQGQSIDVEEYRRRFPGRLEDIEAACEKSRQLADSSTVRDDIDSQNDLVRLLDDYLAALQDGRAPDKQQLLAAHPSLAGQLEQCLAGIDFLHQPETTDTLPTTFGRYIIEGTLGKGAFGVVCLARDTQLNRLVALKVPPEGRFASPGEVERFIAEARVAAQLEHPGIVTVYDVFRDHDRIVIVQQYVPGQDLRRHLEQCGPLSGPRAAETMIAIADAVAAAHAKGIVHRDLKPGNILLDERNQPHVADFGLAVHDATRQASRGDRSGTPEYMSPEQVRGEIDRLDGRSDLWSLGVVLYEMLTGQRPFGGDRSPALFDRIEHDDPPPPRQVREDIPVELERICLKCLAKSVDDRYEGVEQLAEDLRRFLRHQQRRSESPSIAVLPLVDASRERDQDYFCEGMAEELINRLARLNNLRVIARSSVQPYRDSTMGVQEIGRHLNVQAVLQGVVRNADGRLRISAELVNVEDGSLFWSDRFECDRGDVFAIQDKITRNIVQSLALTLPSGEQLALQTPPTTDAQAYDYYLRGRKFFYQYRRKGIALALQMFSLAIKHDPEFALAYAGIADCQCFLALHTAYDPETLKRADEASRKALELAPDLPEAHTSRANVLSTCGRHEEAEREFERALQLGPHLFDAYYLYARAAFAQGKLEQAIDLYRQAYEINPQDYQSPLLAAQSYAHLGRHEEADAARRRGVGLVQERLKVSPDDVRALYMGANAILMLGDLDQAIEWANLALSMEPDEAMVLYNVACIFSLAGRLEEAMQYLERSVEAGLRHKGWLDHDDNLDPLRETERFKALLQSLK